VKKYIYSNWLFFLIIFVYISSSFYFNSNLSFYNDYPINDEGGFAFPIWSLINNGKLYVIENNAAWAIPQIFLGYLFSEFFGFSFFNLRLLSILISSLFYISIFIYLSKINTNKIFNSLILGIFIFFPPIFINSYLFMSDVLFLFLLIVSLYFFENYIKKKDLLSLIIFNIFIIACFSQRQFGFLLNILIFIYIGYSYVVNKKTDFYLTISVILSSMFFIFIYLFIKKEIDLSTPFKLGFLNKKKIIFFIYNFFQVTAYLGLFCIPFLLIQGKKLFYFEFTKLEKNIFYTIVLLCFTANLTLILYFDKTMPYFNNQISKYGLFGENEIINGSREEQIHYSLLILLTAISNISFLLFCTQLIKYKRRLLFNDGNTLAYFSILYFFFTLLLFERFNDRYLIIFFLCLVFYYCRLFYFTKNINYKSIVVLAIFLTFNFFLSILLSSYWVNFSNARWMLTKNFIKENNLSTFKFDGGHEWNYEKYKEYIRLHKPIPVAIKHHNILTLNQYKYQISFNLNDKTIESIKYKGLIRLENLYINKF